MDGRSVYPASGAAHQPSQGDDDNLASNTQTGNGSNNIVDHNTSRQHNNPSTSPERRSWYSRDLSAGNDPSRTLTSPTSSSSLAGPPREASGSHQHLATSINRPFTPPSLHNLLSDIQTSSSSALGFISTPQAPAAAGTSTTRTGQSTESTSSSSSILTPVPTRPTSVPSSDVPNGNNNNQASSSEVVRSAPVSPPHVANLAAGTTAATAAATTRPEADHRRSQSASQATYAPSMGTTMSRPFLNGGGSGSGSDHHRRSQSASMSHASNTSRSMEPPRGRAQDDTNRSVPPHRSSSSSKRSATPSSRSASTDRRERKPIMPRHANDHSSDDDGIEIIQDPSKSTRTSTPAALAQAPATGPSRASSTAPLQPPEIASILREQAKAPTQTSSSAALSQPSTSAPTQTEQAKAPTQTSSTAPTREPSTVPTQAELAKKPDETPKLSKDSNGDLHGNDMDEDDDMLGPHGAEDLYGVFAAAAADAAAAAVVVNGVPDDTEPEETEGEEDEQMEVQGQVEGAQTEEGEGDDEEDDDEDDDDDDDDEDDDDDDDGSESDESIDVSDSPVFVSQRVNGGALGISDLLLPPAIIVKQEPGEAGASTSTAQASDTAGATSTSTAVVAAAGEATPGAATGDVTATAAGQSAPGEASGDPPTNILVAKPKKKQPRKVRAASEEEIPVKLPPREKVTIRINIQHAETLSMGRSQTKIYNFKTEAVSQGVVDAEYWLSPEDAALAAADAPRPADSASISADPVAGPSRPAPSSLQMLLNGVEGGPDEDAELRRLAAQFDKRHPEPQRKRKKRDAEYDTADPFIDDSELQYDEPTYYRQPRKAGFYVQQGPIELLGDDEEVEIPGITPKKRARSSLNGEGYRGTVTQGFKKGKRSVPLGMGNRKPLKPPTTPSKANGASNSGRQDQGTPPPKFAVDSPAISRSQREGSASDIEELGVSLRQPAPKTLDEALERLPGGMEEPLRALKALSDKTDWSQKKIFPKHLIQPCETVGKMAIELDCFDDALFDAMPLAIKYNKHTMKKWLYKRLHAFQKRTVEDRENELVEAMREEIAKTTPAVVQGHEQLVDAWRKKQEEAKLALDAETAMDVDGPPAEQEPAKKWVWAPEARALFWQLVKNVERRIAFHNEACELAPQMFKEKIKDSTARTNVYRRIVPMFPEGFMDTTRLSREMSAAKKREETRLGITG